MINDDLGEHLLILNKQGDIYRALGQDDQPLEVPPPGQPEAREKKRVQEVNTDGRSESRDATLLQDDQPPLGVHQEGQVLAQVAPQETGDGAAHSHQVGVLLEPVYHLGIIIIERFQSLFGKINDPAGKEHDQGENQEHECGEGILVLVLYVFEMFEDLPAEIQHYEQAQDEGCTVDPTEN